MTMDLYIDEKDKELGRARLSQVGEGASARGGTGEDGGRRGAVNGPVTDLTTLELGGRQQELVARPYQLVLGGLNSSGNRDIITYVRYIMPRNHNF